MRKRVLELAGVVLVIAVGVPAARAEEYGPPLYAPTNDQREGGFCEVPPGNAIEYGQMIYVDGLAFRMSAKVSRGTGGALVFRIRDPANGYAVITSAGVGAPGWTEPDWWDGGSDVVLPQPISGDYLFTVANPSAPGSGSPYLWHDSAPPKGGVTWNKESQSLDLGFMDPLIRVETCAGPVNAPPCGNLSPAHPVADSHYYEATLSSGSATVRLEVNSFGLCTDPDGDELTYGWQSGGDVRLGTSVDVIYGAAGDHWWQLYVTDGAHSVYDPEPVLVKILDPVGANNRPQANIVGYNFNAAIRIHKGDPNHRTVTLNGLATDPDEGDTITRYRWKDSTGAILDEGDWPAENQVEYVVNVDGLPTSRFPRGISFEVQDNHGAWSFPDLVSIYKSDLPTLTYMNARAVWLENSVPYDFRTTHSIVLENQDVSIESIGIHLSKSFAYAGCDELTFDPHIDQTVDQGWEPRYIGEIALLTADGNYAWDYEDCWLSFHLLQWCDEPGNITLRTQMWANVTDVNGYTFAIPSAGTLQQSCDLSLTQEKFDAHEWAMFVRGSCTVIGAVAGVLTENPDVFMAGAWAGGKIDEAYGWCQTAHDPPPPDPDFGTKVNIQYGPGTWRPSCEASTAGVAETARQARRIRALQDAYTRARAKLYGVYTFGGNDAVKILQGTDSIRYSRMLADALTASAEQHDAEVSFFGDLTVQQIEVFQNQVRASGLPSALADSLLAYGYDAGTISQYEADILNMEPSLALQKALTDPAPTAQSLSHFLDGQSYFDAPGGFLLAAIIAPDDGGAVGGGAVAVDVRIVDKRESTCWLACGRPMVTKIWIDGMVVTQGQPVPLPFSWNTLAYTDGPHMISIQANDTCPGACQHNVATDAIMVIVDNASPILTLNLVDVDPMTPGIQIQNGTEVTWTLDDPPGSGPPSGIVGPPVGSCRYTQTGNKTLTVCAEDFAGNHVTDTRTFTVIPGDLDGDGVRDDLDNCPLAHNPLQEDDDDDEVGDGCDNCLDLANADQADADADGAGDACDVCPASDDNVDTDGDGVPDGCDRCPGSDDRSDADSDGVPDGCDDCPETASSAPVDRMGCPPEITADFDRDGDVDGSDWVAFESCASGPGVAHVVGCGEADLDDDNDVDQSDFGLGQQCFCGEGHLADPSCLIARKPYHGTPLAVPGRIEAEDYDVAGEMTAYHDTSPTNEGDQYRPNEAVDIERCSEGGYDVGWMRTGEWLEYTVDVETADNYDIGLRVASLSDGGTFHIETDGVDMTGPRSFSPTGGWQTWTTVTVPGVFLNDGRQILHLSVDTEGWNLNWIDFSRTQSPYLGKPLAIPGRIQAEYYDWGGEGAGYHDATPANEGGAFRSEGVDIEPCSEGGYDIGWMLAGEWLEYTVGTRRSGQYDISLRVASESAGGTFHIEVDGVDVTGLRSFGSTGGWQTWTTITVPGVLLTAGPQIVRVSVDSAGWNLNWIDFACR